MSLPPETITIKRKRRAATDDGPVNFLRVEETKRQRSGTWLYRRRQLNLGTSEPVSPAPPRDSRPVIHSSRPGDENIPIHTLTNTTSSMLDVQPVPNASHQASSLPQRTAPSANTDAQPRRFHLARLDSPDSSVSASPSGSAPKRSRYVSALFVERNSKKKRVDPSAGSLGMGRRQRENATTEVEDVDMDDVQPRRLKRPGWSKANGAAETTRQQPQLPPSLLNRQDGDLEKLAQAMNAYTLEQIGLNLAKLDADKRRSDLRSTTTGATPTKYRPKAPAKRFAERHPEVVLQSKDEDIDMDMDQSDTEDEDYVVETYVRIPADSLAVPVRPEDVGLLVFDHEPDMKFFYGAGDESDEDCAEDDDDSNAEDYYTADYPEDEVESDDEYGRDPYHYRTGNASDMEEFDEDEVAESDDDADRPIRNLCSILGKHQIQR